MMKIHNVSPAVITTTFPMQYTFRELVGMDLQSTLKFDDFLESNLIRCQLLLKSECDYNPHQNNLQFVVCEANNRSSGLLQPFFLQFRHLFISILYPYYS